MISTKIDTKRTLLIIQVVLVVVIIVSAAFLVSTVSLDQTMGSVPTCSMIGFDMNDSSAFEVSSGTLPHR